MSFQPIVCPLPAALASVPGTDCPIKFDQIIASGFRRKRGTNPFDATKILTSAAWTDALADTDDGKVILTPAYAGLTLPESEITIDGENDNSTIGGLGTIQGGNIVRPKAMFRNKSAAAMKALRKMTSESANSSATQIEQYFINVYGQIICVTGGAGFDTTNITVSDVFSEGLKRDNMHSMSFSLPYGWSDDYTVYTPSFDILALLPK